jgi:hypothetical protein
MACAQSPPPAEVLDRYAAFITKVSDRFRVTRLIRAVMRIERGGNEHATSVQRG